MSSRSKASSTSGGSSAILCVALLGSQVGEQGVSEMTLEGLVLLGQWLSAFRMHQNSLEGLSKLRLLLPISFWFTDLGGPANFFSNKFPGNINTDMVSMRTTLSEPPVLLLTWHQNCSATFSTGNAGKLHVLLVRCCFLVTTLYCVLFPCPSVLPDNREYDMCLR